MLISEMVPPKARKKSNSCDEKFFDNLNEESAYWLGYILADGCISIRRRTSHGPQFVFSVASKDFEQLEKLKRSLKSTYPIYGPHAGTWQICIPSYALCVSLERCGIRQQKSLTAEVPTVAPQLQPHLLRGIVDGDGCICFTERKSKAVKKNGRGRPVKGPRIYTMLSVAGSVAVCRHFQNRYGGSVQKRQNIFVFTVVGVSAVIAIKDLYAGTCVSLNRKQEKANLVINELSR